MRLLYKAGPMESLRKWFYKPKRDDRSLLAQFFFADDALNMVAAELDSFDGRKDPDRCTTLVNQLRHAQDRVLNITSQIMDQVLGDERVARGFRVKFPEDVLQDNLAGQLWFGAECLAAGSSIMHREEESAAMRPLAKALTRSLETVRSLLREHCLRPRSLALSQHDDMLHETLRIFDRLFAEFELCYVSAMVNVKTPHEFEAQQLICVLFSESLRRALKQGLLTQEQVDSYDPALMFAVPRLAIVSGLLFYSNGPLSIDRPTEEMSDMFRPFRTLLHKIKCLLYTLERRELTALERLLCSNEQVNSLTASRLSNETSNAPLDNDYPDIGEFVNKFYTDHVHCRDLYSETSTTENTITESDYLPDNIEVMTPILEGLRRLSELDDVPTRPEYHTQTSNDTTSTDTFQDKDHLDVRKRSETSELSSLRNLSTNGLMMFDPLVINAAATENRQIPDNDLVTSLNEQVTEIADRLSAIVNSDVEGMEHSIHSFSASDVPSVVEELTSGPRNEQLACLPSTSHGYLIPNAISHEPVVLASLSHNNSTVFNPEDESNDNTDLPLIIPENIDTDIVNANICIANANLTSLLLTNEEYRNRFVDNSECDEDSFHSAKDDKVGGDDVDEKVKFMLGYESEQESAFDSGVSTENTSLDRSPDSDPNKEHFTKHNMIVKTPIAEEETKTDNLPENSHSENINVNIIKVETTNIDNNEPGSSNLTVDNVQRDTSSRNAAEDLTDDQEGSRRELRDWSEDVNQEDYRKVVEAMRELRKKRDDEIIRGLREQRDSIRREAADSSSSRQKKNRKSGSKTKKKRSKMWSPGIVLLENRAAQSQHNTLKLNLDHLVETSSSMADCADDEQIALALQAQELAARQQARGKFKSSEDLIHRLFVCIAGVADQLQTNFAADLRNILKAVFLMNQTPDKPDSDVEPDNEPESEPVITPETKETIEYEVSEDQVIQNGSSFDSVYSAEEAYADSYSNSSQSSSNSNRLVRRNTVNSIRNDEPTTSETRRRKSVDAGRERPDTNAGQVERLPEWIPDIAAPDCMRCAAHFTAFRRRHHCRNCGKVFCASCSSNSIPLPRYGQMKPVRVCEECYRNTAAACRRAVVAAR